MSIFSPQPFDDLSGCVDQWTNSESEPAILSIEAAQTRFHCTQLRRLPEWIATAQAAQAGLPDGSHSANRLQSSSSLASPVYSRPRLASEVQTPVRQRCPHQSGKRHQGRDRGRSPLGSFLDGRCTSNIAPAYGRSVDDTLVSVCSEDRLSHQDRPNCILGPADAGRQFVVRIESRRRPSRDCFWASR